MPVEKQEQSIEPTTPAYSELKIDNRLKKAVDEKKKLEKQEEPTQTLLEENQEVEPVVTPLPKSIFFIVAGIFLGVIAYIFRKEIAILTKKGGSNG